jgi:hypothetical protein
MRMNRSDLIDVVLIVFLAFLFLVLSYGGNAVPVKVASARGQNESRFPISEHMWSSR